LSKLIITIVLTILITLAARVFFCDIYYIPSASMMPTLLQGDYIIVFKWKYGARIMNFHDFFSRNQLRYHRVKDKMNINRSEIIVFDFPNYKAVNDSIGLMFGNPFIKRIAALSGDTIQICESKVFINRKIAEFQGAEISKELIYFPNETSKKHTKSYNSEIFPHDSTFLWSVTDFGQLIVPHQGMTIELNAKNYMLYKELLLYEYNKVKLTGDTVFMNGKPTNNYIFKKNYYFMLGDNFYASRDSRCWVLYPKTI
jgi:signal peptidase I